MLHTLLKLQHHKHTGKKLHHKHTSYRALAILLAICGFGVLGFQSASAADYSVNTVVHALPPKTPPHILSPATPSSVSTKQILLSGSCVVTSPTLLVTIWRNAVLLGSTVCNSAGRFSLSVTLQPGLNTLIPRHQTVSLDMGPEGPPVAITYQAKLPPTLPNPPITIVPDVSFTSFRAGQEVTLLFTINNGHPPLTVRVDWGDGQQDTYLTNDVSQALHHTYHDNQPYSIDIQVTDNNHQATGLKIAAVPTALLYPPASGSTTKTPPNATLILDQALLQKVWVAYTVVLVTVAGLWAGSLIQGSAVAVHSPTHHKLPSRPRKKL